MTGSEQAMPACDTARAERIATLNDVLRKQLTGGLVVATRGVRLLQGFEPCKLMTLLASYDDFDEDNDPHGERDFGDIDYDGQSLLWKIDYYDSDMLYASPDPADPTVTQRVLTVMLPEEW